MMSMRSLFASRLSSSMDSMVFDGMPVLSLRSAFPTHYSTCFTAREDRRYRTRAHVAAVENYTLIFGKCETGTRG
jgi:hypothetical protein